MPNQPETAKPDLLASVPVGDVGRKYNPGRVELRRIRAALDALDTDPPPPPKGKSLAAPNSRAAARSYAHLGRNDPVDPHHAHRDPYAPPCPFSHVAHPLKRRFLRALALTGVRSRAALIAGVHRSTPYGPGWKDDPEFQNALKLADETAADMLEEEVYRRGVEGVVKPTGWYKGKAGGYVREYSDILLLARIKASARGEAYRERVEIRGSLANLDMSQLPDHIIDRLRKGEHPASVLGPYLEGSSASQLPPGRDLSGSDGGGDA